MFLTKKSKGGKSQFVPHTKAQIPVTIIVLMGPTLWDMTLWLNLTVLFVLRYICCNNRLHQPYNHVHVRLICRLFQCTCVLVFNVYMMLNV